MPTITSATARVRAGGPDQFAHRPGPTGRPALDPARRRKWRVRVALSDPERAQLIVRAARSGQRLGPHIRSCALSGSAETHDLISILVQMLGQARGVAGNLNQASHRANVLLAVGRESGQLDLEGIEAEQRAITSALSEIRHWMADVRHVVSVLTGGAE